MDKKLIALVIIALLIGLGGGYGLGFLVYQPQLQEIQNDFANLKVDLNTLNSKFSNLNSKVSDFQFNGTAISFNVTGVDDTTGFCRICIPTALMNGTFRVFVNDTEILPSPEPLPCSNSTHNYLYFTYNHSTQEVIIIPEFPSFLVLPLFMIATIATAVYIKRRTEGSSAR